MIKKIRIRNFKCYGPRGADFNLGRVNFIYGDNSVGKSSFLQFLEMLVDNIDHNERYSRELFAKHLFRGQAAGESSGFVTAQIRVVTENTHIPEKRDLMFGPVQGAEGAGSYALTTDEGLLIGPGFWDGVLPKCGGEKRITHMLAPRSVKKDAFLESGVRSEMAGGLESLGFVNQVEMESNKNSAEYLNDIFKRLGIHYSCVLEGKEVSSTVIHDDDFGIDVEISAIGTGIAGLINLAFTLREWKGGILAIEEPETNVNEAQLGALTKVLIEESAKRPQGQLIVECHSELMIWKLAALVKQNVLRSVYRKTVTGVEADALSDGDLIQEGSLSIHVVSKLPSGSVSRPVSILAKGDIVWPEGFFPAKGEVLRELFGVQA